MIIDTDKVWSLLKKKLLFALYASEILITWFAFFLIWAERKYEVEIFYDWVFILWILCLTMGVTTERLITRFPRR